MLFFSPLIPFLPDGSLCFGLSFFFLMDFFASVYSFSS